MLFQREATSQTDRAYGFLEDLIVTGELPPGSMWSEVTLAELIKLGRTPTREAIQKLAHQRLVRVAPRQGIHIADIDYQASLQVIQLRREIERLVMVQATLLANDKERKEIRRLAKELAKVRSSHDMRAYMRVHYALTQVIGEACRNALAAEFWMTLQTLARRFLFFHQNRHNDLSEICDLHIEQLRAIDAGDTEAALRWSLAKSDYGERFTKEILMELISSSAVTIRRAPTT